MASSPCGSGIGLTADPLPGDVDPALWFPCAEVLSTRDYLFDAQWHTWSDGRVLRRPRIRRSGLARRAARGAAGCDPGLGAGFPGRNLPRQPDVEADDDPRLALWQAKANEFRNTGRWPTES